MRTRGSIAVGLYLSAIVLELASSRAAVAVAAALVAFFATLFAHVLRERRRRRRQPALRAYGAAADAAAADGVVTARERVLLAAIARALFLTPRDVAAIERAAFRGAIRLEWRRFAP